MLLVHQGTMENYKAKLQNGCIGCKICEKKCLSDAIKVVDYCAEIDYENAPYVVPAMKPALLVQSQTVQLCLNTKLPYCNSMGVLYYDIGIIGIYIFTLGDVKYQLRKGFISLEMLT